ncbi:MAG: transglycosylase domain-containing protein [Alphaproteobacteria bacterium]
MTAAQEKGQGALRRYGKKLAIAGGCALLALALKTYADIQPIGDSLRGIISDAQMVQVVDRTGVPLTISYQNRWNTYDNLPLYRVPDFLRRAFILSEDKQFYQHGGSDWSARLGALWQNIKSGHTVRGASTITEQVVRMINPRPRTVWSKWIETFEAAQLERHFSKADILEFYMNQLPYAANRRGVVQAARYYFNRDLSTLSHKEMLALVVLARAPSSFDLYRHPQRIAPAIDRLTEGLAAEGLMHGEEAAEIKAQEFILSPPEAPIQAAHFVNFVRQNAPSRMGRGSHFLQTTLDGALQRRVQQILDERVKALSKHSLNNAAALIIDHTTGEILAWVVAGAGDIDTPGNQIDAVLAPRQPGSALKPFLYAMALERGWSPATILEDSPLAEAVGSGLHRYKNYSNTFYGKITLREALANSLNIPAVRTIQHVGPEPYLALLHQLGFASLDRGAEVYDDGLALGNGEVTLYELVQGYAVLAHRGIAQPLTFLLADDLSRPAKRLLSEEATSLIAHILSDPWARRLEFGSNSLLNFPVQTAAKTGTSTDYHDAWAVGFNYRYAVGIWMGNLDRTPTDGVTGSRGPALALRSIFAQLNRNTVTKPLFLSPKLVQQDICLNPDEEAEAPCFTRTEYFIAGTEPGVKKKQTPETITLMRPTDGLQIALDPRIPADRQKFEFYIAGVKPGDRVDWIVNGVQLAQTDQGKYLWDLARGHYRLKAVVHRPDVGAQITPEVLFAVK